MGTTTRDKVAAVLQRHALGLGLTIPEIRAAYPANSVRRTSILEALQDLEATDRIEWVDDRVRWIGPLEVERVFGEDVQRIRRDQNLSPQDRIEITIQLSSLARRRENGTP